MDTTLNTPTLSAIMIVYNGAHFIESAIRSVLEQTYSDFELLILNDGSTDKTEEVILSMASLDSRIRYLKNDTNMGLSYSRNKIIRNANGNYIAVTDSDDISISTRFEKQMNFLLANSSMAVLGSAVTLMNDKGELFDIWHYPIEHKEIEEGLKTACVIANPASIFKKDVFTEVNGYNEQLTICEDWDFFVRAAKIFSCHNLSEPLIHYRIHNNNISKNKLEHTIIYSAYLSGQVHEKHLGSGLLEIAKLFPELKTSLSERTIQFYSFWIDTYSKLGYRKLSEELYDFVCANYFVIFDPTRQKKFKNFCIKIYMKRKHFLKAIKTLLN
jgi:glycosyltransferase involved in cell wall biosynthesis